MQEKMKAMEERIAELEIALSRATLTNGTQSTNNINYDSSSSLFQFPSQLQMQINPFTFDFLSPTTVSNLSTDNFSLNSSHHFPILQQLAQSQLSLPTIQSRNDLPFSAEIIDDMVNDFFIHCNSWPVNFLHPTWFKKNRHTLSKPLLYIVCAISSRHSKYLPLFHSVGRNPGEELYQRAKRSFDFMEVTLENFMCLFFMSIYNVMVGRLNEFWVCLNSGVSMVGILKLFMDPNELELTTNSPMSDIEKECRRRLWWLVRGMVAMSPNTMKMIEGHITVSRALPISVYHAMPVDLDSPPQFVELDMYDIEDLSHDLNSIAKSIQDFVDTVVAENRSVNNCFIEADLLMEQLRLWYSRCPQWFHTVLDSTNICTSTDRKPHEIPFLAFHIHLMYFSLPLTLYRFVFSSFCLFPPELQTPRSRSPAVQQALDICWNSINLIMLAYRTKPILMEASSYTTYPYVLGPLLHSIAFSCTMSKFADTPEQCIAATRDFKFTRQLLAKIISGSSNWQFVNYFLEDIDRVNSLPAGLERMNETMRLFTFHSQLFEKLFLKKGILTSVL